MYNLNHTTMNIINTFIVCRITNTIHRIPKFFKVYEIDTSIVGENEVIARSSYILDDRGEMALISKTGFEELQNNMKELGL